MSELDQRFEKAAIDAKNLAARPNDLELLDIYALFKQATVGDCDQPKPNFLQLKEKAKHESWEKLKGMSQTEAKEKYCDKVVSLVKTYKLKA